MDWIDLGQDRVVAGCYTRGKEPSGSVKFGELLD